MMTDEGEWERTVKGPHNGLTVDRVGTDDADTPVDTHGYPLCAVGFNLTYRCNLHCEMCAEQQQPSRHLKEDPELDADAICEILADIAASGTFERKPMVRLTGGEPLLKPGVERIIATLDRRGFPFAIQTNGTLLNETLAGTIARHTPRYVHFSLDGPAPVHDAVRGLEGAYQRTIEGIERLQRADPERTIPIFVNCVINKRNLDAMVDMVEIADELGVGLRFQHLMFIDDAHEARQRSLTEAIFGEPIPFKVLKFSFAPAEVERIVDAVETIMADAPATRFLPPLSADELEPYYLDLDGYIHSATCTYPFCTVRINPYGDVYPCMNYYYGTLTEQRFAEIYHGARRRKFLTKLRDHGHFPGCIRCCKL